MKPENWITLGNLFLTVIGLAIGLSIGPKRAVRLALEQFRSQRWWERQATVYDDIIRSASRLCGYHTECYGILRQGDGINGEWRKEALEKNRDALVTLSQDSVAFGVIAT